MGNIFGRVGLVWVMPRRVAYLLASRRSLHGIQHIVAIRKIILISISRCNWREKTIEISTISVTKIFHHWITLEKYRIFGIYFLDVTV